MTMIVAMRLNKNKFIMGGDRCLSDGSGHKMKDPIPKIKKIGNTLLGAAGNVTPMTVIMNMKEWNQLDYVPDLFNFIYEKLIPKITKKLNINELREVEDKEGDRGLCDILICSQNKCFELNIQTKGVEILEVNVPAGVGCGWANALGAMAVLDKLMPTLTPKEKLILTMEAVANVNGYCDDNIDIIVGGDIKYE